MKNIGNDISYWESGIIDNFQKSAHLHHKDTPDRNDAASWNSLMQHHGCPTRFLDWTASPFVALYFAISEHADCDHAVWAINRNWIQEILAQDPNPPLTDHHRHSLKEERISRSNVRLGPQQGILLSTGFSEMSFALSILKSAARYKDLASSRVMLAKVKLLRTSRIDFLQRLLLMNVNAATLFPGADGAAKEFALRTEIDIAIRYGGLRPAKKIADQLSEAIEKAVKDRPLEPNRTPESA